MGDVTGATMVDYGIRCAAADEQRLVRNVNGFLASLQYRKMYRKQDTSIQSPERSFRLAHYYCQFMKAQPRWYFDLRPNVDLDGKARFPGRPEFGWTLFTNKSSFETCSAEDHRQLDRFFAELVAALGFPAEVLHVYDEADERL